MAKPKTASARSKTDAMKRASMAIEDLLWSLQRLKLEHLRDAAELLKSEASGSSESTAVARSYKSGDPNKHFLIGVLPRLFQDKDLFPQNEDIADFAASALGLEMSRTEKRSRYEIIGKVVCETDLLDESRLTNLVTALEKLVGSKERLAEMRERKRSGSFSWNETIQDLLKP